MLAAFCGIYVGFLALSLTIARHRRQLLPGLNPLSPTTVWGLRTVGGVGLAGGLFLCMAQHGIGIGVTYWAGLLSAAALLLSVLTVFLPRLALGLGLGLLVPWI
ncbi:MAG: DUF3325 family protein [Pseudomonadota bacterium]